MPERFSFYTEESVQRTVDNLYPFPLLEKWAHEEYKAGKKGHNRVMLTYLHWVIAAEQDSSDFWMKKYPYFNRQEKVGCQPSTGKKIDLMENGKFFPLRLHLLEDPLLSSYIVELQNKERLRILIPEGIFINSFRFGAILLETAMAKHQLDPAEMDYVVRDHCLSRMVFDLLADNPSESAFLLYAGAKIIQNNLQFEASGK
jgi:hypothetical protein